MSGRRWGNSTMRVENVYYRWSARVDISGRKNPAQGGVVYQATLAKLADSSIAVADPIQYTMPPASSRTGCALPTIW